jgi:hypothetical protein
LHGAQRLWDNLKAMTKEKLRDLQTPLKETYRSNKLTERYCVVLQTLHHSPAIELAVSCSVPSETNAD